MATIRKYWKVRTDEPYLSISLKKLNMSDVRIKRWSDNITKHAKEQAHKSPKNSRYVFVNIDDINENDLGWSSFTQVNLDWHKENGYKYYGEVKVEDYEADAIKYNL